MVQKELGRVGQREKNALDVALHEEARALLEARFRRLQEQGLLQELPPEVKPHPDSDDGLPRSMNAQSMPVLHRHFPFTKKIVTTFISFLSCLWIFLLGKVKRGFLWVVREYFYSAKLRIFGGVYIERGFPVSMEVNRLFCWRFWILERKNSKNSSW
jgi:hypothetical protein